MPENVSALQLVLTGDPALFAIVRLSLIVSLSAVLLAALIGLPFGAWLALSRFRGREGVIVILNALMGLPPVVVGLCVFLMLSRSGPLGSWGILFTPQAMIIAQTILIAPIIAALARQTIEDLWLEYRDELEAMNVGTLGRVATLLWDGRFSLLTALLAGFGRAAAEVGAVIIVGGNIDGFTRTMTTAIALETSKGDLPLAIGLGMVLIAIVIVDQCRGLGHAPLRRADGGMTMRAPVANLPIHARRRVVRRARRDHPRPDQSCARRRRADRHHRSERRRQDHPAPPRHGPDPADRRARDVGRTRGRAVQPPRHRVPAAGDAPAQRRGQPALRAGGRRTCRAPNTPRALRELLALVGLAELGDRPARKLSGGEQQRLALARALAKDPQVLFLDEPTASLDPAATKAVEDLVRDVAARGIKVVMSTHDLGEARRLAGEIVLMHRGRIVEVSDAATFFNNPKTDEARRFVAGELLI